jgi:hypothetical protein
MHRDWPRELVNLESRGLTPDPLPLLLLRFPSLPALLNILIHQRFLAHAIPLCLRLCVRSFLQPHIQRVTSPLGIVRRLDQMLRELAGQLHLRLWIPPLYIKQQLEHLSEDEREVDEVGSKDVTPEQVFACIFVHPHQLWFELTVFVKRFAEGLEHFEMP